MNRSRELETCKASSWTRDVCVLLVGCVVVAMAVWPGSHPSFAADADLGTWMNSENKGKIQLRECGENSLCGQIVWLKEPLDENGKPWRDINNPDQSLRGRQVVGIDVMIGTKKIAPNTWQGQIYDPEVGKVYYLKHLIVGRNKVEIKGCLSSGWPCRTKYWSRTQPVKAPALSMQVAKRQAPPPPAPSAYAEPPPAPRNVAPPPAPTVAMAPPPTPVPRPRASVNVAPRRAPPPVQPVLPQRPEVTAALPPAEAAKPTGGYLVQVAARQSHNEALRAFSDLQQQFPQLLGGLAPEVLRADLGQRGIWYRVGVGPMLQQQAAADFCNQLKSMGADCLIRRR